MWDSPNLLLLLLFDKITVEPRCGMLYMDGAPLTWDLLVATWTHTLPEAINRSLREMVSPGGGDDDDDDDEDNDDGDANYFFVLCHIR